MKLYCNIEKFINNDGTNHFAIKEGPCKLPQNSSSISNLNLLDDETLKVFGWVPVVQNTENYPVFVSVNYEIFEDKVIETTITRQKTKQELEQEIEQVNSYAWQELRQRRNQLLNDSDKLIPIDKWEKMSAEDKQKIIEYRQKLRDLPLQNSDPNLITFPTL